MLQTDRMTYSVEPDGDEQLYKLWKDEFNLAEHDVEIKSLLSNCPNMRVIYQEMVISLKFYIL